MIPLAGRIVLIVVPRILIAIPSILLLLQERGELKLYGNYTRRQNLSFVDILSEQFIS